MVKYSTEYDKESVKHNTEFQDIGYDVLCSIYESISFTFSFKTAYVQRSIKKSLNKSFIQNVTPSEHIYVRSTNKTPEIQRKWLSKFWRYLILKINHFYLAHFQREKAIKIRAPLVCKIEHIHNFAELINPSPKCQVLLRVSFTSILLKMSSVRVCKLCMLKC